MGAKERERENRQTKIEEEAGKQTNIDRVGVLTTDLGHKCQSCTDVAIISSL